MINTNTNIRCHPYLDWHYGGLQFHNEHHSFPCMPRYNLRLISKDLQKYCKKHEINYEVNDWFWIMGNLVQHMKRVSKLYVDHRAKKAEAIKA